MLLAIDSRDTSVGTLVAPRSPSRWLNADQFATGIGPAGEPNARGDRHHPRRRARPDPSRVQHQT